MLGVEGRRGVGARVLKLVGPRRLKKPDVSPLHLDRLFAHVTIRHLLVNTVHIVAGDFSNVRVITLNYKQMLDCGNNEWGAHESD